MREKALHKALRAWVMKTYPNKVTIIKLSTMGRYGTAGWPDWLVLIKPRCAGFIELKAEGETCTKLQLQRQQELRDLGFEVTVVDNRVIGKRVISNMVLKAETGKRRFVI